MPALNFHERFVDAILSGEKTHTIRKPRQYPFIPGQPLYLYTNQRSKHCKKLMDAICTKVASITIKENGIELKDSKGGRVYVQGGLDDFAKEDGFKDWENMKAWWLKVHGLPFKGIIIYWNNANKLMNKIDEKLAKLNEGR